MNTCARCGDTTRYRHHPIPCEWCGTVYCRQRNTGRWCSETCKSRSKLRSQAARDLREARILAIDGWAAAGSLPDDAPVWLRRGAEFADADRDCHAPVKDAHLVEGWPAGRAAVGS